MNQITLMPQANAQHKAKVSALLFSLNPNIRYVAVDQNGKIAEMEQSPLHPSTSSVETDRREGLFVNPVVLGLTTTRGNLDLNGLRYVVIRYGGQYQVILPYRDGHVSIGINSEDDPIAIASEVQRALGLEK
jgi:hypothetical protein